MTEEVSMFEMIINRIAERSETTRQLRASDEAFKTMLVRRPGRRCTRRCNGCRRFCGWRGIGGKRNLD